MKSVLVVRKLDDFSRILAANGCRVINLPLIKTVASDDLREFENKLAGIENYDGVFLTSAPAAEIFRAKLVEKEIDYQNRVYILGRRGYEILKGENLDLFYEQSANTAREMLERIAPGDLKGKRFLFVRGEKSLRVVPDFLSKVASVDEAIVYRTEDVAVETGELNRLREKFGRNEIAAACFFSPSAADSFVEQFGTKILHQTFVATIGKTTAEFFVEQNLKVDFIASKATAQDFAVDLLKYLKGKPVINKLGKTQN